MTSYSKKNSPTSPLPPQMMQPSPQMMHHARAQYPKRMAPRPHISLNIPPPYHHNMGMTGSPYNLNTAPGSFHPTASAGSGPEHPNWPPYANPFNAMYSGGNFMIKRFGDIKDFTMELSKSGLSLGEKSAFYIYKKFSEWSRRWLTHIFLFLVILLYSVAGAFIFVAVEG